MPISHPIKKSYELKSSLIWACCAPSQEQKGRDTVRKKRMKALRKYWARVKSKKNRIPEDEKEKFAEKIRKNLPESEKWFWNWWRDNGMAHETDRSNEVFCGFIPDVLNDRYQYVIEIDGDIHLKKSVQKKDQDKEFAFCKAGYTVFRIKAYDESALPILADEVLAIREKRDWKPKYRKTILRREPVEERQVEAAESI